MPHIPLQPDEEYTPQEICEYGWILNTTGKPDYRFVLRLIKRGILLSRNVCTTGQTYYKVRGDDIIQYKEQNNTLYWTEPS